MRPQAAALKALLDEPRLQVMPGCGMRCSGPRYLRAMISRSAARACSQAFSGVGSRDALRCGSSASMRASSASASSTGDSRRLSINWAASAILSQ